MRSMMFRPALLLLCALPLAACGDKNEPAVPAPDAAEVDAGVDTAVVVDSDVPDTAMEMDTAPEAETAPPAVCGNGTVESGEACDDGNAVASDGCSPACTVESTGAADVCPGSELALTLAGTSYKGSVSATTVGAYGHYAGSCGGGLGPDHVYMIKPTVSGSAFLRLASDVDATLYVRTACDKPGTESSCNGVAPGGVTTANVVVTKDMPLYVFVDGLVAGGKYTLSAEVIEARCGDGAIQLGEQCDDGNATAGDGCSATCRVEAGGVADDCPGMPFQMKGTGDAPRKLALAGDNTTANDGTTNTYGHGCGNYYSGNHVYAIKPDMTGSLKIETNQAYANASFSVASECNNRAYTLWCDQTSIKGNPMDGTVPVTKDQWVYIIIDGGGGKGPYTANLTLTKGACGNHVLDGGEVCDDGNTTDGDGCSATCTFEAPSTTDIAALDKCPGKDLTFPTTGAKTVKLTSSTALPGIVNDYTTCGDSVGTDVVYHFTASVTGSVVARLDAKFAGAIALRTVCSNTGNAAPNQPACIRSAPDFQNGAGDGGYGEKKLISPITAGTEYWLVVDSRAAYDDAVSKKGIYELEVTQQVAVCGNGIVDAGETCDDGDTNDNDGCSATCQLEPVLGDKCTDAISLTLTDDGTGYKASKTVGIYSLKADSSFPSTCGIGNSFGRDAFFRITAPASGILKARVRDATFDASIGVQAGACTLSGAMMACVDGAVGKLPEQLLVAVESGKDYWIVVDMSSVETAGGRFTLDASIAATTCGDGLAGGTEECDDGNTKTGDGCDASCKLETITGADDCPGTALTLAGTGVRFGTITLDTAKLTHAHAGKCNGSAAEGVVQITPDVSGTLVARAIPAGAWSPTIYARATCADPATDVQTLTCSSSSYDPTRLTTTVAAGRPLWLFLDGIDGSKGTATVTVQITP